ncbi:MAG: phospholipase D-like domain-containing protein [Alphaproteobacteria bacterium]
MNSRLLRMRWTLASYIGGILFFSFLSGNANCADEYKGEHDQQQAILMGPMERLPNISQSLIISYLPSCDKGLFREVSRKYRDIRDLTFFGPVYDPSMYITPFSSEISGGTIGSNIFKLISAAQRRIIIASDKCTNEEFLDDLLALHLGAGKMPLEIRIVTGEDRQTQTLFSKAKYANLIHQLVKSNRNRSGKMHNKFIVIDDDVVITGSPNLTYAAYNYNVESFVAIHHKFVAKLYFRYYHYIISGKDKYDNTQDEYRRVGKMMHVFNSAPGNPIQVCLAPILDIKSFVVREFDSSQLIDINMFLVSRAHSPDDDIIANLLRARQGGAAITIKVDEEQYKKFKYIPKALAPLIDFGVTAYTVSKNSEKIKTRTKRITTIPQFHDKLALIRHKDGSAKVFIGSAGFTDNVQDNLNLENMVLLRIPEIYEQFLIHFNAVNGARLNVKKIGEDLG